MNTVPYPTSFPNPKEEEFLRVVLSDDADFRNAWNVWKNTNNFDDTDFALSRLMPLLYLRMAKMNMQDDPFFGRIKGIYRSAWVINQRFLAAIREFAAECNQEDIPIVLLKGIPILLDVYQDSGARFTGDADIFAMPEYAPQIISIMHKRGWHYSKPWMPDVSNPVQSMYEVSKSSDFVNDHGVAFDIHWNIFGLYHHANPWDILLLKKDIPTIAFRDVYWESIVPMNASGISANRLSNEDMLIHVIVHGAEGNTYRTLRWVTDAAAIIQKLPINWNKIIERTRQFGLAMELSVGFRYLSEQMNLNIPQSFLSKLQSIPTTKGQIKEFERRANMTGGERFSPMNNILMFWYAYWVYEPCGKLPKTVFGFIRYVAVSLGMSKKGMFGFIVKKYFRKIVRQLRARLTPMR